MDPHPESEPSVRRFTLPSGRTIEVVYFGGGRSEPPAPGGDASPGHPVAEPYQELHVCPLCDSELVYPVTWEEAGPENWAVLLHCPSCEAYREGVFSQENVEAFDEELDRGTEALTRDYERLARANMAEEIERFVGALRAGAILPEDF